MKASVTFESLRVFQASKTLCLSVYPFTFKLPLSKDFALIDQIRRSAGSIMDNIAEGYERGGNKELIQFLFIAKGSAGELRSQIIRAKELGYLAQEDATLLYENALAVSKMLSAYITYLKRSDFKGPKYTP